MASRRSESRRRRSPTRAPYDPAGTSSAPDKSAHRTEESAWSPYARVYDPVRVGSINGSNVETHDRGLVRAARAEYKPNKLVKGDPKKTIFVGRLHPATSDATIRDRFAQHGTIRRLRLVLDKITGASRRYAFVEYKHGNDAEKAYRQENKMMLDGQEILVDMEHERLLPGWKPRRLGGGFGGKKGSGQLRFGCRDLPWRRPRPPLRP